MFSFGPAQILILLAIVLLLFGKRVPTAMNALGRSLVEFKRGVKEIDSESGDTDNQPHKAETEAGRESHV